MLYLCLKHCGKSFNYFESGFSSPGGGYVNLDTYKRACNLPDSELIILNNEGTFHQVHGGISANRLNDTIQNSFKLEYENLRGKPFEVPTKKPLYFGSFHPETKEVAKHSLNQAPKSTTNLKRVNRILLDH